MSYRIIHFNICMYLKGLRTKVDYFVFKIRVCNTQRKIPFFYKVPYMEENVRCSAIEGISYRYHRCGPVCMLEDKG
jgi:hypothetical protein